MDTPRRANHTALSPHEVAGQATFTGYLTAVHVDRRALRSLLPAGVVLDGADLTQGPCLLACGEQSEGLTYFGGFPLPWGARYHELMVAIPGARRPESPVRHLLVSGMTCDFWPAVWNGNLFYGFGKRHVPMRWDGRCFQVVDRQGEPSFLIRQRSAATTNQELLDWIRATVEMPILGCRPDGSRVVSRFAWDFSGANVESVQVDLELSGRFAELPMKERRSGVDGILVQGMRWQLSWPTPISQR